MRIREYEGGTNDDGKVFVAVWLGCVSGEHRLVVSELALKTAVTVRSLKP
jgi:hypothetical protein